VTGICSAFVSATSSSVISACWIVGAASPRPKRVPVATVEKVLALYREKYFDLNVRIFTRSYASSSSCKSVLKRATNSLPKPLIRANSPVLSKFAC
jgi:hypothetical protein